MSKHHQKINQSIWWVLNTFLVKIWWVMSEFAALKTFFIEKKLAFKNTIILVRQTAKY
jgi:hypothetical protein